MNQTSSYKNPDIVVWEITLKCNLKCLHCGSSAGEIRSDELTTEEAINLCRGLSEIGFKGNGWRSLFEERLENHC